MIKNFFTELRQPNTFTEIRSYVYRYCILGIDKYWSISCEGELLLYHNDYPMHR